MMKLLNGLEVVELTDEEVAERAKIFTRGNTVVKLTPNDWLFPAGYSNIADTIYKMQVGDLYRLVLVE